MHQLSASEARQLFDRFRSGAPARLDTFLDAVRDLGGPVEALDRSLPSLETLWPWFLDAAGSMDVDEREAADPWWAAFHRPWVDALGGQRAVLVTGLAEYVFACVASGAPGSRWAIGRRASNRRQPVLEIPGRGEMGYAVPIGFTVRALAGDLPADREPSALRRLAEIWLGLDATHEAAAAALARPVGPWAVRAIDQRRFTHELSFDDETAHRRATRIARLVDLLGREPGIGEAVHEDREVALLSAPGLTIDEVRAIVARLWAAGDRPHGNAARDVP